MFISLVSPLVGSDIALVKRWADGFKLLTSERAITVRLGPTVAPHGSKLGCVGAKPEPSVRVVGRWFAHERPAGEGMVLREAETRCWEGNSSPEELPEPLAS